MAIIDKPSDYFNTILYTGNGNSGHAQTGVGFQPDWVWLKSRTNGEYHNFYDVVRGVTKRLSTQPAGAAQTTISGLTAFGSDGFTVGAADTANQNSQSFVAWNWKETTDAGFDIVSYTGTGSNRTVAHNLGVVPQMIIIKRYNDGTASWMVYHQSLGNNKYLSLDATAAEDTGHWNSTSPTASVFSVDTDQRVNANGASYIAYVFAEEQGYSKFGSYTGNGNANGTFIYTGFKPAWVMSKTISAVDDWQILDNKRNGFNPNNFQLVANSGNAEQTSGNRADFLSNGFKIRTSGGSWNPSGGAILYMAFAENPFVTSTGNGSIPACAR